MQSHFDAENGVVIQESGQLILQGNHQPDPTPTIAQYPRGSFLNSW